MSCKQEIYSLKIKIRRIDFWVEISKKVFGKIIKKLLREKQMFDKISKIHQIMLTNITKKKTFL